MSGELQPVSKLKPSAEKKRQRPSGPCLVNCLMTMA
jgi:hypothetical protein